MRSRKLRPAGRFVCRLAEAMGLHRTPRVSTSCAFITPFATGIRRPEICLPDRVTTDLGPSQLRGLLAHEMAHISRGDPGWLLLYRLIEGAFFFQPLNRLARRRLVEMSEILADARAVACTGDRTGLAGSLVDVASWATERPRKLLIPAAAAKGPSISKRVAHLLAGPKEDSTMPKLTYIVVFLMLTLSIVALPTVSSFARVATTDEIALVANIDLSAAAAEPAPRKKPNANF